MANKLYNQKTVASNKASVGDAGRSSFTYKGFSSKEITKNYKLYDIDLVKQDIINYLPKVKKGGIIGGHDYVNGGHLKGVYDAVNEIFGTPDKTFKDGSWIKFL